MTGLPHHPSRYVVGKARYAIFSRDGFECLWCLDEKFSQLSVDHVIPVSKMPGETLDVVNAPDNIITSCRSCNKLRANMSKEAFASHISLTMGERKDNPG